MEDRELMALWKSHSSRLEASVSIQRSQMLDITSLKVQGLLGAMRPIKRFAILVGLIWVLLLDGLLFQVWDAANAFFLVSALGQVILTKLAIGLYAYQLLMIERVGLEDTIVETQAKIAKLKTSTLWAVRILWLQLPLWTTFYWNESMLVNGNLGLWLLQGAVTVAFAGLAIWLFLNLKMENRDKRWFRWMFQGKEWDPMMKAMDLLDQVHEATTELAA